MANLAKSPGGVLWSENDAGRFTIAANWNVPTSPADINLSDLPEWLRTNEWIIDLREWQSDPDIYRNLALSTMISAIPNAWLIIPLLFGDKLQGIVLLRES